MFAGDEQDVAKAMFLERARFAQNFIHCERHAEDGVVAREAAISAVVDALVGNVQRREESNDFAEALLRERLRTAAKRLQQFAGGR